MMRGAVLIAIALIVCAGLGVYGWLAIHHADTAQFLYAFGTIGTPTIALLWNTFKTQKIADKVDVVENNTNGRLDILATQVIPDEVKKVVREVVEEKEGDNKS